MHILRDPSFFFTNKTRGHHGEILGLMKHLSRKSLIWNFNLFNFPKTFDMEELKWGFYRVIIQCQSHIPIREEPRVGLYEKNTGNSLTKWSDSIWGVHILDFHPHHMEWKPLDIILHAFKQELIWPLSI